MSKRIGMMVVVAALLNAAGCGGDDGVACHPTPSPVTTVVDVDGTEWTRFWDCGDGSGALEDLVGYCYRLSQSPTRTCVDAQGIIVVNEGVVDGWRTMCPCR